MHQLLMQAKEPVITIFKEKEAFSLFALSKQKIKDKKGYHIEVLAMLDSGSNKSFISKTVAKKLGIRGYKTHLTMNLPGGQN